MEGYVDIPAPNVSCLKRDLDTAFHSTRSGSSPVSNGGRPPQLPPRDDLQVLLSGHGKQIFEVTKGQVPVYLIPSLIPERWFDWYTKSLIMSNQELGKRSDIEVDDTGQYMVYYCDEPGSFYALARATSYKLRTDAGLESLETMLVVQWEDYNWFATGLLTTKPAFKHAVKRTWQATPRHAFQAMLERNKLLERTNSAANRAPILPPRDSSAPAPPPPPPPPPGPAAAPTSPRAYSIPSERNVRNSDEAAAIAMDLGLSRDVAHYILYRN